MARDPVALAEIKLTVNTVATTLARVSERIGPLTPDGAEVGLQAAVLRILANRITE